MKNGKITDKIQVNIVCRKIKMNCIKFIFLFGLSIYLREYEGIMMTNKKDTVVTLLCTAFSLIFGIIHDDIFLGSTILATGLLSFFFASEGRRVHYILGFINYLLMGYVSLKNHLYGIFFFYTFIFAPLETQGYITWSNNLDPTNQIVVKSLNLKNTLLIIIVSTVGSIILGYILSLIPSQRLALLDAISNILNLFGTILLILQYRESWWILLMNNIMDLIIWLLIGRHIMMIIVSFGFLLINIYGILKWYYNSQKIIKKTI